MDLHEPRRDPTFLEELDSDEGDEVAASGSRRRNHSSMATVVSSRSIFGPTELGNSETSV